MLLSGIYNVTLSIRGFLYKTGLKKTRRLPSKVISIGNLTLGGTGKTPATIALAEEAKRRGLIPCILTRGYKGKAKKPCFINASHLTPYTSHLYGDEAVVIAERLKDVPIVKGRDRYKSGIFAIDNLNSKLIFILDDGFQHWALYRDVDVLLINATNPFGNERLFPEGILREPLNAIKRAHIIVLTKTDAVTQEQITALSLRIRQYNSNAPLYMAFHKPVSLINPNGVVKDLDFIKGKRVYAFSGIANPSYFKTVLSSVGSDVVEFKPFKDHYRYRQQDINKIIKKAEGLEIITTEKDLVKLKGLRLTKNIFALSIEFSINKEFFDYALEGISY